MYAMTVKHVMTANMRAQNSVKIKTQAVLDSFVIYDMSQSKRHDVVWFLTIQLSRSGRF